MTNKETEQLKYKQQSSNAIFIDHNAFFDI